MASHKPPDPTTFAKNGSEHGHQVALFVWASQQFQRFPELKWMFAIPNGGERNKIVASHLKAEGCKRGVPDVFLPVPRGGYHGLFIELKRPKGEGKSRGYTSEEQDRFRAALHSLNYGVYTAVGWEAARDVIVQYLSQEH